MELTMWVKRALKDIILFSDVVEVVNGKGVRVTRDVSRDRALAIGLINSNSPKEFYDIARQVCPPGTVVTKYFEDWWTEIYDDKSKLAIIVLTKALIDERLMKSAKFLLEILSKRSKNWKDDNNSALQVKAAEGANIVFSLAKPEEENSDKS